MAAKGNTKKGPYTYNPSLQPLSKKEKEELKMRIIVAIRQSIAVN